VYRRSHYAILAEEHKEKEFQQRINAAVAVERKREAEIRADLPSPDSIEAEKDELEARAEIEAAEREEQAQEVDSGEADPGAKIGLLNFPIFDAGQGYATPLTKARTAGV
jgi:hypothetical protein